MGGIEIPAYAGNMRTIDILSRKFDSYAHRLFP